MQVACPARASRPEQLSGRAHAGCSSREGAWGSLRSEISAPGPSFSGRRLTSKSVAHPAALVVRPACYPDGWRGGNQTSEALRAVLTVGVSVGRTPRTRGEPGAPRHTQRAWSETDVSSCRGGKQLSLRRPQQSVRVRAGTGQEEARVPRTRSEGTDLPGGPRAPLGRRGPEPGSAEQERTRKSGRGFLGSWNSRA